MQLKTILNHVEKHSSFVYGRARFTGGVIIVPVKPRANGRPVCSSCGRRCGTKDTRPPRLFQFVPLLNIPVFFHYAMRRVNCPGCGVRVERVPWCDGKSPVTKSFAYFLASWAKRLSWKEVAQSFQTSWDSVFRAVELVVNWGLAHRDLKGVEAIGVDEVKWRRGPKFLTVVYEIGAVRRRLLWVGRERTEETLRGFFDFFGKQASTLKFVCSDMWKPYLNVIARKASQALHVLDRFHIVSNMGAAIDEVRAKEVKRLKREGRDPILKNMRWVVVKRRENLSHKQAASLKELLSYNLNTTKAYLLATDFHRFWDYVSPAWATKFLDQWCRNVLRTRIEPMKRMARSLRNHRELILNWFRARGHISLGATEGMNNKLKLTTRRAYGFRTFRAAEIALYHSLGDLPEPPQSHRFC